MATLVLAFQHISCYFLASVVKLQCPKCIQATEWKHRSSHHYWILFHSWSTTGLEGQPGLQNFVKLPSNSRPVHKQKKPGNDWMRKKYLYPSGPSDKDIKNIGSDWWAHSHISLTCQGKNNAMKSHTVYNSSGLNVYNVGMPPGMHCHPLTHMLIQRKHRWRPLRATAIELTASGMDVAAARKVKPEIIVGISRILLCKTKCFKK